LYNELHKIWKQELENAELQRLPSDFYSRIARYLKKAKEESRMLDRRNVRAHLLKVETQNVKSIVYELTKVRYEKIIRKVVANEKVPLDVLTSEEREIYTGVIPVTEAYQSFVKNILQGYLPKMRDKQKNKRVVLRFLKSTPAIIGADLKTYGPFKVEDLASLPVENAKVMIRQGLAQMVRAS